MSVIKAKRNVSSDDKVRDFKVFTNHDKLYDMTIDLICRNFGYSYTKAEKKTQRRFGGKSYEELSPNQQKSYDVYMQNRKDFEEQYIPSEKNYVLSLVRRIGTELRSANSVSPVYIDELVERRLHQDRALEYLFSLEYEMQCIGKHLSINMNSLLDYEDVLDHEIKLVKGWRTSDHKRYKKTVKYTTNYLRDFTEFLKEGLNLTLKAGKKNEVKKDCEEELPNYE